MTVEDAVAFMVGISASAIGISFLSHGKDWAEWLRKLHGQGRPAALIIGYMHLIVGTFIVGFHWKWAGLPLLVTLIGTKAIAEGFVYTLFPNGMLRMLVWYAPHSRILFRIAGVITLVIAVVALCEWQQSMHLHYAGKPCFNPAPNASRQ